MSFYNAEFNMAAWMSPPVVEAVSLEVEGTTQKFNLMICQGRVGFRQVEREDLWWMTTEILPSGQNVEEFWRQEVSVGRFGRTFVAHCQLNMLPLGLGPGNRGMLHFEQPPRPLNAHGPYNPYKSASTFLCLAIIQEDNSGLIRRMPDGEWFVLPFVPFPPRHKPARGARIPSIWRAEHRFFVFKKQLRQLYWRLLWGSEYEDFRLWHEKTLPEIERLVRAWFIVQCSQNPKQWVIPRLWGLDINFVRSPDASVSAQVRPAGLMPEFFEKLIGQHGIPHHWFFSRNDSALTENECTISSALVQRVAFQVDRSVEFSHHERLEAYLGVRDWLRGKISEEEISKLLHEGS